MSSLIRSRPVQRAYEVFHYHFLSEQEPGNTLPSLTFDTDVRVTLQHVRRRRWTAAETVHFLFLLGVIFFVFVIFPALFWVKTPILAAFVACFCVPLTAQFFVHALPIFAWLALFFLALKIPRDWKPAISVKFLPAMETILYGDNLLNVLAEINHPVLDVMAWLPYGVVHFSSPFVVALFIFLFAPPTSLHAFGFAFGYMNLFGVLVQLLFPAAPPWYKNIHGLEPANYGMSGLPGGLARIDALFGGHAYTNTFENSPLVFGAFPSLHLGCAVMDVLFLCWLFPRYTPVWWLYVALLWWSTMYLTHHYFIDLIFGAALSFAFFTFVKYTSLPVIDRSKYCRWSYSEVHRLDVAAADCLGTYIPLRDMEDMLTPVAEDYELETGVLLSPRTQPLQLHSQSPPLVTSPSHDDDTDHSTELVFDAELHMSGATSHTLLAEIERKA